MTKINRVKTFPFPARTTSGILENKTIIQYPLFSYVFFFGWIPISSWTQIAFALKILFSEDNRRVFRCKDERRTQIDKYVPLLRQHRFVWEFVIFFLKCLNSLLDRSPVNSSILPSCVTHKFFWSWHKRPGTEVLWDRLWLYDLTWFFWHSSKLHFQHAFQFFFFVNFVFMHCTTSTIW